MWILLKNALARLFRSPVQSIAALVASFIITSASILSFFLPDIIKANNRAVVNAATAGFDILFAGTSIQEEDSARFSSFADKLIEEGAVADAFAFQAYTYTIELEDDCLQGSYRYVKDPLGTIDALNIPLLETTDAPSEYPDVYVSYETAKHFGFEVGQVLPIQSPGPAFVRGITDSRSIMFDQMHYCLLGSTPAALMNFYLLANTPEGKNHQETIDYIRSRSEVELKGIPISLLSYDANERLEKSLGSAMTIVYLATGVMIVAFGYLLFYSYSLIAEDRAGELVRFKAIGATPGQCVFFLFAESAVYALTGTLLGIGGGYGLCQLALSFVASNLPSFELPVAPTNYLLSVLLSLGISFLCSLLSSFRFAKQNVASLMRKKTELAKKPKWPMVLVPTSLLSAASAFLYLADIETDLTAIIVYLVALTGCAFLALPPLFRILAGTARKRRSTGASKIAFAHLNKEKGAASLASVSLYLAVLLFLISGLFDIIKITGISNMIKGEANYQTEIQGYATVRRIERESLLVEGVEEAVCTLQSGITEQGYIGVITAVSDPSRLHLASFAIEEEVQKRFEANPDSCIISYNFAKHINVEVGDYIEPIANGKKATNRPLRIVGYEKEATSNDFRVYTRIDNVANYERRLSFVLCFRIDPSAYRPLSELIQSISPAARLKKSSTAQKETSMQYDLDGLASGFEATVIAAALLAMANYVATIAAKRGDTLNRYRLIGASNSTIFRLFLIEALAIFSFAFAFGFLLCLLSSGGRYLFGLVSDRYIIFPLFDIRMVYYPLMLSSLVALLYFFVNLAAYAIAKRHVAINKTRE